MMHFLIAGAFIFGLYYFFADKPAEQKENQIYVSIGDQQNIRSLLEKTKKRPLTEEEFKNAMKEHIDEKIFYKEALALGLDANDKVIEKRLSQKLKLIIGDVSVTEPTEEELQSFLDENKEKYKQNASYMFKHIYFEEMPENPQKTLKEIQQTENINLGDVIDMPKAFKNASSERVQRVFGADFEKSLSNVALNEWVGPVLSAYGYHYIKLIERQEPVEPSVKDIQSRLSEDWRFEQQTKAKLDFIKEMREKYDIIIEENEG